MMMDIDQVAKAVRDEEMLAEIEDFIEGFNQPSVACTDQTCRKQLGRDRLNSPLARPQRVAGAFRIIRVGRRGCLSARPRRVDNSGRRARIVVPGCRSYSSLSHGPTNTAIWQQAVQGPQSTWRVGGGWSGTMTAGRAPASESVVPTAFSAAQAGAKSIPPDTD
jgi:hypothetical protein